MRPAEAQAPGGIIPRDYPWGMQDSNKSRPIFVVPLPFDYWTVQEVNVPLNTPIWLDSPDRMIMNRRAWAVVNTDPTVGNNVWVGPNPMSAVGQGGRILAQGGSLSVPGGVECRVHAFTNVVAGVIVAFYQFA